MKRSIVTGDRAAATRFIELKWVLLPIAFLTFIALLMFGFLSEPALVDDDWSFIASRMVSSRGNLINWSIKRPLLYLLFTPLIAVFKHNLHLYQLTLAGLILLAAILLYALARRLLSGWPLLALLVASIALVYPADYSRAWLMMINIWAVVVAVLLFALLLLIYGETGRFLFLAGAWLALIFSFGIYEAQIGVTALWCLVVLALKRPAGWRHRLGIVSPLFLITLVIPYRLIIPEAGDTLDPYLNEVAVNPLTLIGRLIIGAKMLAWSWIEALRQYFDTGAVFDFTQNLSLFAAIIAIILVIWALITLFTRYVRPANGKTFTAGERKTLLATGATMLLIGSLLAVAGYVPYVTVAEPSLAGLHSRSNIFAIPGAAAATTGLLFLAAAAISRNRRQLQMLLIGGALPLIIIGLATQIWIQRDWSESWQEQKQIWNDLFQIAPDLSPDTSVYFILPGYQERSSGPVYWKQPPLAVEWAADYGLKILYGTEAVQGDVILPGQDAEAWFSKDGILNAPSGEITPYRNSILLLFDGAPRRLRVIEDPTQELGLSNPTPGYAPFERIEYDSVPDAPLRRLVEQ